MFGMTKDIGIDLGTANTLVYMRGKGIIIREPSVVAVDKKLQCVRYVGQEAKDVIGRTPGSIVAVRPLKDGVIADFDMTSSMLEQFIKKALRGRGKARVIICIPSGVTEVERRAVKEAAQNAGAKRVSIIEEPMAAAIGAGLPVAEPVGSMIVDIGGGTSENITVTSEEIREAISEPLSHVIDAIKTTLEKTPPELAADIIESGIMLAGGGALLRGLDQLIHEETGMPVKIAERPLDCVADGTGKVLENIDKLEDVLSEDENIY